MITNESPLTIENGEVTGCKTDVENVVIPAGVTGIGDYAFELCNLLEEFCYAGTKEEWNKIEKGIAWQNQIPAELVHCDDGDVKLPAVIVDEKGCLHGVHPKAKEVLLSKTVTKIKEDSLCGTFSFNCFQYEGTMEEWEKIEKEGNWLSELPWFFVNCSDGEILYPSLYDAMEDGIFSESDVIEHIIMPYSDDNDEIPSRSFESCTALKSLKMSDTVKIIGDSAFSDCSSLSDVVLGKNLAEIGAYSFAGCCSLKSLKIPLSVSKIGRGILCNCESFEKIEYEGTKEDWKNIQKDKEWHKGLPEIILKFSDGEFKVPWFIHDETDGRLYLRNRTVKSLKIPCEVKIITDETLHKCYLLESLEIPKSVVQISDLAFKYCRFLSRINYDGTKSDWERIQKNKITWNVYCRNVKVQCSDGEL